MRDSMIFYRSFYEAIKNLPNDQFAECARAIIAYGLDGEVPEPGGIAEVVYAMAKPQIDKNNIRYENGTKGGRPKTETKPNDNQTETKAEPKVENAEPNVNVNVNVNDNDNVNANDKDIKRESTLKGTREKDESKEDKTLKNIVNYLNEKCGTRYRVSSEKTKKHINARLAEGYSEQDFYDVIDKKSAEWQGTEWEKYLRPDTLFGSKFESYLNQKINTQKEQGIPNITPFMTLKDLEAAQKHG